MKNSNDTNFSETRLIEEVSYGNRKAFEQLFFENYYRLCRFAFTITRSHDLARDSVQDVFLKVWRNREKWNVQRSLKAYLYQAVRNQALNLLEQQNNYHNLIQNLQKNAVYNDLHKSDDSVLQTSEIVRQIWKVVDQMPEQRKQVFELSRKHGLSHREISEIMCITTKTVEYHIRRALQDLRKSLDINWFFEKQEF